MKPTKIKLLKDHLKSGKTITQLEAIGLYSLYRLAARVHELKQRGWPIVTNVKRDTNGSEYAEYALDTDKVTELPNRYRPAELQEVPFAVASDAFRS